MRSFIAAVVAGIAAWAALSERAAAQDFAPPPAASASSNGVTFWMDGSWRSVGLPTYVLGLHNVTPGDADAGAVQSFGVRPTGYGVSGGIGFALPPGSLAPAFGSNARVSLQGGYVNASVSQDGAVASADNIVELLDGQLFSQCTTCTISSRVSTRHDAWWASASGSSDWYFGGATVSPVIEILGGASRTKQDLSQSRDSLGNITTYDVSTNVRWSDVGARIGIGVLVPIVPTVDVGLGGKIGFVQRWASLSGTDSAVFVPTSAVRSSSIGISGSTAAFLAGLQGQLIVRPMPNVRLRAFAGLDYDSRVPGIVAPTFTPAQLNSVAFAGSAATLGYSGETSYFAGGGIVIAFSP